MTYLTEKQLEQREQASLKHGAYSFESRGEAALTETNRTRFAELSGIVQTRPGVISLLQERCVQAVLMCEILESYIVGEKQSGKKLEDIPALKYLPAFQNSSQRAISTLLQQMHEDPNTLDAGKVLEALQHDKNG